jgi:C4-dicarboxylate transporter, DctQ subunit
MTSSKEPESEGHTALPTNQTRASLALLALRWGEAIASWLAMLGAAVSTLLVLVVLAITAVNVVARYGLASPIAGVDEATGFLVVVIVMLGAAEALRRDDHIRIDILHEHLGRPAIWWLDLLAHAGVLVFALFLLVMSCKTVAFSYAFGAYSSGYLELALWVPQSSLVIGALLLALVALARLVRQIVTPLEPSPDAHPPARPR